MALGQGGEAESPRGEGRGHGGRRGSRAGDGGHRPQLREESGRDPPPEPPEGAHPADTLILDAQPPRRRPERTSLVLSCSVCAEWLWPPAGRRGLSMDALWACPRAPGSVPSAPSRDTGLRPQRPIQGHRAPSPAPRPGTPDSVPSAERSGLCPEATAVTPEPGHIPLPRAWSPQTALEENTYLKRGRWHYFGRKAPETGVYFRIFISKCIFSMALTTKNHHGQ